MEFLQIKNIDYKQNEYDYNEYKSKLVKLKELIKDNKKYDNIYKSFESLNNKNSYLHFLLFQHYKQWININFENNNDIGIYTNKLSSIMKKFIKVINNNDNNKKINLYLLFINWLFYLYNEFVKYLYIIFNPNYNEINKIRYIIIKTNKIIIKLYKENIFNINQIFDLVNFIILLIEINFESKSNSDKLYKAKNYFFITSNIFYSWRINYYYF